MERKIQPHRNLYGARASVGRPLSMAPSRLPPPSGITSSVQAPCGQQEREGAGTQSGRQSGLSAFPSLCPLCPPCHFLPRQPLQVQLWRPFNTALNIQRPKASLSVQSRQARYTAARSPTLWGLSAGQVAVPQGCNYTHTVTRPVCRQQN